MQTYSIEEDVLTILREVTMQDHIDLDSPFYESGIDSVVALELVMMLERKFLIEIPDDQLPNMMSPRSVIDLVRETTVLKVGLA